MRLLLLLLRNVHYKRINRKHPDQGHSQKRTTRNGFISSVSLTMAVILLLAKNNLAFSNQVMLGRNSYCYSLQHRIGRRTTTRSTTRCRRYWQAAGTRTALFSNTATSALTNTTTNLVSIDDCLAQWNHHQQQQQEASSDNSTTSTNTIQFVDATWFHKGERNGRQEFEEGPRLPGAIHWDIGDLATTQEIFPNLNPQGLKNVFPPEYMVGKALEQMLGSSDTTAAAAKPRKTTLVVYGRKGTLFLPRVWYMLKKYCKDGTTVKILNGSIEEWQDRGGPVEEGPLVEKTNTLNAKELMKETSNDDNSMDEHSLVSPSAKDRLVDKAFVLRVIENNNNNNNNETNTCDTLLPSIIIDTRGSSFAKKGHMPGAIHIPYASFFASDNKDDACSFFESKTQLKEALKEALKRGTTEEDEEQRGSKVLESLATKPPLLTCGTGVSVCTMALVLDELGFPEPWIYDGSWDEWGKDPTTPKIV